MKKVILLFTFVMFLTQCGRKQDVELSSIKLSALSNEDINKLIHFREFLDYSRQVPFEASLLPLDSSGKTIGLKTFEDDSLPSFGSSRKNIIVTELNSTHRFFNILIPSLKKLHEIDIDKIRDCLIDTFKITELFAEPLLGRHLSQIKEFSKELKDSDYYHLDYELIKIKEVYFDLVPGFEKLKKSEPNLIDNKFVCELYKINYLDKKKILQLTNIFDSRSETNSLQKLLAGNTGTAQEINKHVKKYLELTTPVFNTTDTNVNLYNQFVQNFRNELTSYEMWPILLEDFNTIKNNLVEIEKEFKTKRHLQRGMYNVFTDVLDEKNYFEEPISYENNKEYLDIKTAQPGVVVRVRFKENTFKRLSIQNSLDGIPVNLSYVIKNHDGKFSKKGFTASMKIDATEDTTITNLLVENEIPLGVTVHGLSILKTNQPDNHFEGDSAYSLKFTFGTSAFRYEYDNKRLKNAEEQLGLKSGLNYVIKEVNFVPDSGFRTQLLVDWKPSEMVKKISNSNDSVQYININLDTFKINKDIPLYSQFRNNLTKKVKSKLDNIFQNPSSQERLDQYFHSEKVTVKKIEVDSLNGIRMAFSFEKARLGNTATKVESGDITYSQHKANDGTDTSFFTYSVGQFDYKTYRKDVIEKEVGKYIKPDEDRTNFSKKAEIVSELIPVESPQIDLANNTIEINTEISINEVNITRLIETNTNLIEDALKETIDVVCSEIEKTRTFEIYGIKLKVVPGSCDPNNETFKALLPSGLEINVGKLEENLFRVIGDESEKVFGDFYLEYLKDIWELNKYLKVTELHFAGDHLQGQLRLTLGEIGFDEKILNIDLSTTEGIKAKFDKSVIINKVGEIIQDKIINVTDKINSKLNFPGLTLKFEKFDFASKSIEINGSKEINILNGAKFKVECSVTLLFKEEFQTKLDVRTNGKDFANTVISKLFQALDLNFLTCEIVSFNPFTVGGNVNLKIYGFEFHAGFTIVDGHEFNFDNLSFRVPLFIPILAYVGINRPGIGIDSKNSQFSLIGDIAFGADVNSASALENLVSIKDATVFVGFKSKTGIIKFKGDFCILNMGAGHTDGEINFPQKNGWCQSDLKLLIVAVKSRLDFGFKPEKNCIFFRASENGSLLPENFPTFGLKGNVLTEIEVGKTYLSLNANANVNGNISVLFFNGGGEIYLQFGRNSTFNSPLVANASLHGEVDIISFKAVAFRLNLGTNKNNFQGTAMHVLKVDIPFVALNELTEFRIYFELMKELWKMPLNTIKCFFNFFKSGKICPIRIGGDADGDNKDAPPITIKPSDIKTPNTSDQSGQQGETNNNELNKNGNNKGAGDKKDGTGDKNGGTGDKKDGTGDKKDGTGDKNGGTGDKKDGTGDKNGGTGDKKDGTGDKNGGTGDKKDGTGDKNGGTGDKNDGTGDKNGGTGDKDGRTADKKDATGDKNDGTSDKKDDGKNQKPKKRRGNDKKSGENQTSSDTKDRDTTGRVDTNVVSSNSFEMELKKIYPMKKTLDNGKVIPTIPYLLFKSNTNSFELQRLDLTTYPSYNNLLGNVEKQTLNANAIKLTADSKKDVTTNDTTSNWWSDKSLRELKDNSSKWYSVQNTQFFSLLKAKVDNDGTDIGIINYNEKWKETTEKTNYIDYTSSNKPINSFEIGSEKVKYKFNNKEIEIPSIQTLTRKNGPGVYFWCVSPYNINQSKHDWFDLGGHYTNNGKDITLNINLNNGNQLFDNLSEEYNKVNLCIVKQERNFIIFPILENPLFYKNNESIGKTNYVLPEKLIKLNKETSLEEFKELLSENIKFKESELNFIMKDNETEATVSLIQDRINDNNSQCVKIGFFKFIDRYIEDGKNNLNSPVSLLKPIENKKYLFFIGREDKNDPFDIEIINNEGSQRQLQKMDLFNYFKSRHYSTEQYQNDSIFQSYCHALAEDEGKYQDYFLMDTTISPLFVKVNNAEKNTAIFSKLYFDSTFKLTESKIYIANDIIFADDNQLTSNKFYNFSQNVREHKEFYNLLSAEVLNSSDTSKTLIYLDKENDNLIAFTYNPSGDCKLLFENQNDPNQKKSTFEFISNLKNGFDKLHIKGLNTNFNRLSVYNLENDFVAFGNSLMEALKNRKQSNKGNKINPLILFGKNPLKNKN